MILQLFVFFKSGSTLRITRSTTHHSPNDRPIKSAKIVQGKGFEFDAEHKQSGMHFSILTKKFCCRITCELCLTYEISSLTGSII